MFHKRLLKEFKYTRKYTAGIVICQWFSMVANVLFIFASASMMQDMIFGAVTSHDVVTYLVLTAVFLAVRFVSGAGRSSLSVRIADRVKSGLRTMIFSKLLRLGGNYHEKISTSEVVQVSTEGAEQLEFYMSQYVPQFFYSMVAPLTLFAIASTISLKVALVLLVCLPLIPVSIIVIQKIAKRLLGKYWGSYTHLGDSFLECLQGLTTLKIYGSDEEYARRMDEDAEKFRKITMRVLIMQLNSISVMDVVAYGGAAVGIALSILEYTRGDISFMQCFFMLLISAEFFLPLRMLGSFFHIAMNGNAAADKIFALMDIEEECKGTLEDFPEGDICFRDISFGYEGSDRLVLDGCDVRLPAKGMTAIVGGSGCGKSTLASLLMGEHTSYSGGIFAGYSSVSAAPGGSAHGAAGSDGSEVVAACDAAGNASTCIPVEMREIAESVRLGNITKINHSSYIFKGTVASNLLMGDPQAGAGDMEAALKQAGLYDELKSRGGLDMAVTERGTNLSGGQRQRLALARALLCDSPVYIFDEATSNVDVESEDTIMDVIRQLAETKSVLLISHRLANVVGADRIYVMSEGRICETGTHEELMAENGEYHRMFRLQQELESYSAGGMAGEENAGGESCDMNAEPESAPAGDSSPVAAIAAHGDMNVSSIHDVAAHTIPVEERSCGDEEHSDRTATEGDLPGIKGAAAADRRAAGRCETVEVAGKSVDPGLNEGGSGTEHENSSSMAGSEETAVSGRRDDEQSTAGEAAVSDLGAAACDAGSSMDATGCNDSVSVGESISESGAASESGEQYRLTAIAGEDLQTDGLDNHEELRSMESSGDDDDDRSSIDTGRCDFAEGGEAVGT